MITVKMCNWRRGSCPWVRWQVLVTDGPSRRRAARSAREGGEGGSRTRPPDKSCRESSMKAARGRSKKKLGVWWRENSRGARLASCCVQGVVRIAGYYGDSSPPPLSWSESFFASVSILGQSSPVWRCFCRRAAVPACGCVVRFPEKRPSD